MKIRLPKLAACIAFTAMLSACDNLTERGIAITRDVEKACGLWQGALGFISITDPSKKGSPGDQDRIVVVTSDADALRDEKTLDCVKKFSSRGYRVHYQEFGPDGEPLEKPQR